MLWRIPVDTHEQRIDRWPPPDNRQATNPYTANSLIIIACSAPPTRCWPASSASPAAPFRTGSPPTPTSPTRCTAAAPPPRPRFQPPGLAHYALSGRGAHDHEHGGVPVRQPGLHVLAEQSPAPLLAGQGGGGAGVRTRSGGGARCRGRERAPCWRLSTLIGVSLAGIVEIVFRGFRRSGHCASMRAVFRCSAHLARSSRSCAVHCSSRVGDEDGAGPQPRQATAPYLELVHQRMTTCTGSVIGASQVILRQT